VGRETEGWTPNPLVGCVLVRDGEVVGEGYHAVYGGPHAEVVALEAAGPAAEGATAYVSLEPCNHHGKTPPCSEALLAAGVRRVVYGAADPPTAARGGAEALRSAGVEVVGPVWSEAEARAENPAFFHVARHGTPYVALKLAMSLDAKIAAAPGARTRITGPEAEREVHRLRSGFDAVLVGAGTVRADDPRLTVRLGPPARRPVRRMLLSPSADLPAGAALLEDLPRAGPVDVFVGPDAPGADVERLEAAGVHVHAVPAGPRGLDLGHVLRVAWTLGARSILCEGGRGVAATFLREGRAQRLYLFVAPRTLGASAVPAFEDDADTLDWSRWEPAAPPARFGRDTLMVLDLQEASGGPGRRAAIVGEAS